MESHASNSKELLHMGIKNNFTQDIENFFTDPISNMFGTKQHLDKTLKSFINKMVSTYLNSKKDLISKVYRADTGNGNLFYCISLKDDSLDNRININDFFDFYSNFELYTDYPVFFQFVPDVYMDKVIPTEKIIA